MRNTLRVLGIVAVLVAYLPQSASADSSPSNEVRHVLDAFFSAAERRDWDAAGGLMSPEFKIYVEGVAVYDRPAYVALLKADDMTVLSLDLQDVEIFVSSDGRMAWSRYKAVVNSESKGVRTTTHTAETLIFEKTAGDWFIRHAHVSLAVSKPGQEQ